MLLPIQHLGIKLHVTPSSATVWLLLCISHVKRRTYYPLRLSCLQIELEFVVTDDLGATAFLRPIINLCACHNNGVCLHSASSKNSTHDSNKMNVLECGCLNGYTGTFCESDLDACEANLNPCYPGVKCIDLPPPANISGYKCGPCPNGFTGDGSKCRGIHFKLDCWHSSKHMYFRRGKRIPDPISL